LFHDYGVTAVAAIRHSTYICGVGTLGNADVRGVLEFLDVACEVDGIDPFPNPVLAALRRLIPADVVSYGDYDPDGAGWRRAGRIYSPDAGYNVSTSTPRSGAHLVSSTRSSCGF
jgi:hypothetical protein